MNCEQCKNHKMVRINGTPRYLSEQPCFNCKYFLHPVQVLLVQDNYEPVSDRPDGGVRSESQQHYFGIE